MNLLSNSDGRQYRSFDLKQDGNKIEGYAVVFNQRTLLDRDPYTGMDFYESIDKGAFDGCDMSDVVLNVDPAGTPIARTRAGNLMLTVDEHGLRVCATLTTSRGKEVWEDIAAGNLDKMSFAFNIGKQEYDKKTHTRNVLKISKLYDVSVVTHPAYEQTCVFARASMAVHIADEQRAYVSGKLQEMQRVTLQEAPEMRTGSECWAGMEYDIQKHTDLLQQAAAYAAWTPEGSPADIAEVEKRHEELLNVASQINQLAAEEQQRIAAVESGAVQFYGWEPEQIQPNSKEQIEALVKRNIKVRLFNGASEELKKHLEKLTNTKRSISMMNDKIEIRALQSYLCKGIAKMDDDERRALTTTGSGAAVIPTEIADHIITNAGYSVLTHRAKRFADGRRGKLLVPTIIPTGGGVGWHDELDNIDLHDQLIGSVAIEGMELVKIIAASTAMTEMVVDQFENYIQDLLAGELLDTLEKAYITGKKGEEGPADGLDNLDLTERTIPATDSITIENIAAAVAKLPSKVQKGAIVMGNASTLANLLTTQGTYAFDMRTTLKDMGVELVQNPYVSDGNVYVVGQPNQSLLLNFWQPISVAVSTEALFMKAAIAIRALAVVGFAWVPDFVAKVAVNG